MGFLRKQQEVIIDDSGDKTPIKFRRGRERTLGQKNRSKKIKRAVILTFTILILALGGFFGFRAYNALRKVFTEGSGDLLSLFGGNQAQQLKGESSGRTNILLLGVGDEGHSGATLSDTMIIVSIDARTKNVAMFSVPRDLYVQIPNYGYAKINSAHAYGEQYKVQGGGPALAKSTIEKNFGLTIHYFVRVDFSGLQKIVDSLGGVTVDVENSFCDYNYPTERKGDSAKVCFTQGSQQMNGTKALQYARSRHALGVEGSDFARSERQQRLLVAIKNKALSADTVFNPKKSIEFLEALGDHIKTDFTPAELPRLYEISKEVDQSKIITKNFDNSPEGLLVSSSDTAAGYILKPRTGNFKEIQEVIRNIFSSMGVKNESASIELLNGTYTAGLVTTVGESMKAAGYNIVKSGNADNKNYTKTIIFDYSGGKKPETLKALEKKFGVTVTSQTPPQGNTIDFKIIIGRDYKEG